MNNKTRKSILFLLGVCILLCTASNSYAKEIRYHYIDLGTLGGGFSWSNGINNWGQVVGVSQTELGALRAFVWTRNEMKELESLESDLTSMAWSLNDRGQAVGFASGSDNRTRAILWDYAGLHELETPEGTESNAVSINRRGEIAGYLTLPNATGETYHAAFWDSEGIVEIHPSESDLSLAYSINKKGEIVGAFANSDGFLRGALWDKKGIHELGTLGGETSEAYWINDKGQVVGRCDLPDGTWHACSWTSQGDVVDLGSLPGRPYSDAWSINHHGEAVGNAYINADYEESVPFIWTEKHGMRELSTLADLPAGVFMVDAYSINDFGWIAGSTTSGTACLLIPYKSGKEKNPHRHSFKH